VVMHAGCGQLRIIDRGGRSTGIEEGAGGEGRVMKGTIDVLQS
jgi:hypothetical protein